MSSHYKYCMNMSIWSVVQIFFSQSLTLAQNSCSTHNCGTIMNGGLSPAKVNKGIIKRTNLLQAARNTPIMILDLTLIITLKPATPA